MKSRKTLIIATSIFSIFVVALLSIVFIERSTAQTKSLHEFRREIKELYHSEGDNDNILIIKSDYSISDDTADMCAYGYNNIYVFKYDCPEKLEAAKEKLNHSMGVKYMAENTDITLSSDLYMDDDVDEFGEEFEEPDKTDIEYWGDAHLQTYTEEDLTEEIVIDNVISTYAAYDEYENDETQDVLETADDDIIVAVIDSGIDYYNPAFFNRIISKKLDYTWDESIQDTIGHGTAVASIITQNSSAKIMPIKVVDKDVKGNAIGLYLAIETAIQNDADIINLSLTVNGRSELIEEAIKDATENGIVVVAAAGNQSANVENYSPANIEDVITVSALDETYQPASYTNWGSFVDYAALGKMEALTLEGTKTMEGTSMSAAYVSAICAEVLESGETIENGLSSYLYNYGLDSKREYYGNGILSFENLSLFDEPNESDNTQSNFKINQTSIDDDTYKIEILTEFDEVEYTFDGGQTWQSENYIEINRKEEFYDGNEYMSSIRALGIKDKNGNTRYKEYSVVDYNNQKDPASQKINLEAAGMTETSETTGTGYYDTNADSDSVYIYSEFIYDINDKTATLTYIDDTNTDKGRKSITLTSTVYVKYNGAKTALTVNTVGDGTSAIEMSLWRYVKDATEEEGFRHDEYTVTQVVIPKTVKTINAKAFYNNTDITKVTFAASSTCAQIGDRAFQGCANLTNVVNDTTNYCLPATVKAIKEYAFCNTGLNAINTNTGVISIGDYAFINTYMSTITLGKSVTTIGKSAFENCGYPNTVTIGTSVSTIGENAFKDTNPTKVTWNAINCESGGDCFSGKESLTSVSIYGNVQTIPAHFLDGCINVQSAVAKKDYKYTKSDGSEGAYTAPAGRLDIPKKCRTIGEYAFKDCKSIQKIGYRADTDGDGQTDTYTQSLRNVESIGDHAFDGCGVTYISITDVTTYIGDYAFANCASLTKLLYSGNGPEAMNPYLCYNDTALTQVRYGKSLTYIYKHAFDGCSSLNAFSSVTNNRIITGSFGLSNKISHIGDCAFKGCTSDKIARIALGSNVRYVGAYAFNDLKAKIIQLPYISTAIEDADDDDAVSEEEEDKADGTGDETTIKITDSTKCIKIHYCNYCGACEVVDDNVISITNPYIGDGCPIIMQPSCSAEGVIMHTCKGKIAYETISPTYKHIWGETIYITDDPLIDYTIVNERELYKEHDGAITFYSNALSETIEKFYSRGDAFKVENVENGGNTFSLYTLAAGSEKNSGVRERAIYYNEEKNPPFIAYPDYLKLLRGEISATYKSYAGLNAHSSVTNTIDLKKVDWYPCIKGTFKKGTEITISLGATSCNHSGVVSNRIRLTSVPDSVAEEDRYFDSVDYALYIGDGDPKIYSDGSELKKTATVGFRKDGTDQKGLKTKGTTTMQAYTYEKDSSHLINGVDLSVNGNGGRASGGAQAWAIIKYTIPEDGDYTFSIYGYAGHCNFGSKWVWFSSNVNEIVSHEHEWGDWVTTEPTCTNYGLKTRKCISCGAEETKILGPKGHFLEEIPAKAPTCTEYGATTGYICVWCNEILVIPEQIEPLGHDWVNTVIAPTCTEQGYTNHHCNRDSTHDYKDNYTQALGHDWTKESNRVKTAPTCTEEGKNYYDCNRCGSTENTTVVYSIPALGHITPDKWSYNDKDHGDNHYKLCQREGCGAELKNERHTYKSLVEVNPTCTTKGTRRYTCTVCGYNYTEDIAALGHHASGTWVVIKAPTCTEKGTRVQYCDRECCVDHNVIVVEEEIPALGHNWVDKKENSNGITDGHIWEQCDRCGITQNHQYKQIVKVRYQKADGSFTGYSDVINDYYENGDTISWSRAQDETYEAASISYTVDSQAKETKIDVLRRKYTVKLIAGTGIELVNGADDYYCGASVTIKATLKTGYHWDKWTGTYTSADNPYTFIMPTSDVTETANGVANTYTVYLYPNKPSNPSSIKDVTILKSSYTSTDYNGWTWDATNKRYQKVFTYDASIIQVQPDEMFSLDGYTVGTSWYTSHSAAGGGTETTYTKTGKNLTSVNNGEISLYPSWTDKEPTASVTSTDICSTTQTVTLTANDKGSGIASYYWGTTDVTSSTVYTSINCNSDGSFVITKKVSEAGTYYFSVKDKNGKVATTSITFYKTILDGNKDDGTSTPTVCHPYSINKAGGSITPTASRTGYTFMGWSTTKQTPGHTQSQATLTISNISSNSTWYAVWQNKSYTITYDKNGTETQAVNIYGDEFTTNSSVSSSATKSQITYYDYDVTFASSVGYTRTGYTFKEWNTKSDGSGTGYLAGTMYAKPNLRNGDKNATDVTLYAIWEPIRYNVVYCSNDDSIGNWNTTDSYNNNSILYNRNKSGSSWLDTYTKLTGGTVRFDQWFNIPKANTMFNRNASVANPKLLTNNIYVSDGYVFYGWSRNANTETVDISNNSPDKTSLGLNSSSEVKVRNLNSTSGTVKLYALWKKNVSLSFNMNGGKYNGDAKTIKLSATLYSHDYSYTFKIINEQQQASANHYTAQENSIDAYGSVVANGLNTVYTKVSTQNGTTYRFLGWETSQAAANKVKTSGFYEPYIGLDANNSEKAKQYQVYDSTTLYAVYEPVLSVNASVKRTLGTLADSMYSSADCSVAGVTAIDSEVKTHTVVNPGEQISYMVSSLGSSERRYNATVDSRIKDIYIIHSDAENAYWFDELNTLESLTALETVIENFDHTYQKMYIPLYLGTTNSYSTSNPNESNNAYVYTLSFEVEQPSYYYNKYVNDCLTEKVIIESEILLGKGTNGATSTIQDLKTELN